MGSKAKLRADFPAEVFDGDAFGKGKIKSDSVERHFRVPIQEDGIIP